MHVQQGETVGAPPKPVKPGAGPREDARMGPSRSYGCGVLAGFAPALGAASVFASAGAG